MSSTSPSGAGAPAARGGLFAWLRVAVLQVVIIAAVTLALLEGLVAFSFSKPGASPIPRQLLRYLHVQFDRHTIQVMPECARYDDQVTYTLKPGRCTFSNREFSSEYRINSKGLRDDEDSLQQPRVIMIGDSLTMGWGVEQEEAFPQVFERLSGKRTLNAGISSYGTFRALRLLERLDRSAMEALVLQYSDNDLLENEQFVRQNGLRILTEAEYLRTVENHRRDVSYFPGKYAINLLVQLRNMVRDRVRAAPDRPRQDGSRDHDAQIFLKVLERSPVPLEGVPVTVVSLDSAFIAAAVQQARVSTLPWAPRIRFVDMGPLHAVAGAFYVLDDHPTAAGHQAIARELARQVAAGQ